MEKPPAFEYRPLARGRLHPALQRHCAVYDFNEGCSVRAFDDEGNRSSEKLYPCPGCKCVWFCAKHLAELTNDPHHFHTQLCPEAVREQIHAHDDADRADYDPYMPPEKDRPAVFAAAQAALGADEPRVARVYEDYAIMHEAFLRMNQRLTLFSAEEHARTLGLYLYHKDMFARVTDGKRLEEALAVVNQLRVQKRHFEHAFHIVTCELMPHVRAFFYVHQADLAPLYAMTQDVNRRPGIEASEDDVNAYWAHLQSAFHSAGFPTFARVPAKRRAEDEEAEGAPVKKEATAEPLHVAGLWDWFTGGRKPDRAPAEPAADVSWLSHYRAAKLLFWSRVQDIVTALLGGANHPRLIAILDYLVNVCEVLRDPVRTHHTWRSTMKFIYEWDKWRATAKILVGITTEVAQMLATVLFSIKSAQMALQQKDVVEAAKRYDPLGWTKAGRNAPTTFGVLSNADDVLYAGDALTSILSVAVPLLTGALVAGTARDADPTMGALFTVLIGGGSVAGLAVAGMADVAEMLPTTVGVAVDAGHWTSANRQTMQMDNAANMTNYSQVFAGATIAYTAMQVKGALISYLTTSVLRLAYPGAAFQQELRRSGPGIGQWSAWKRRFLFAFGHVNVKTTVFGAMRDYLLERVQWSTKPRADDAPDVTVARSYALYMMTIPALTSVAAIAYSGLNLTIAANTFWAVIKAPNSILAAVYVSARAFIGSQLSFAEANSTFGQLLIPNQPLTNFTGQAQEFVQENPGVGWIPGATRALPFLGAAADGLLSLGRAMLLFKVWPTIAATMDTFGRSYIDSSAGAVPSTTTRNVQKMALTLSVYLLPIVAFQLGGGYAWLLLPTAITFGPSVVGLAASTRPAAVTAIETPKQVLKALLSVCTTMLGKARPPGLPLKVDRSATFGIAYSGFWNSAIASVTALLVTAWDQTIVSTSQLLDAEFHVLHQAYKPVLNGRHPEVINLADTLLTALRVQVELIETFDLRVQTGSFLLTLRLCVNRAVAAVGAEYQRPPPLLVGQWESLVKALWRHTTQRNEAFDKASDALASAMERSVRTFVHDLVANETVQRGFNLLYSVGALAAVALPAAPKLIAAATPAEEAQASDEQVAEELLRSTKAAQGRLRAVRAIVHEMAGEAAVAQWDAVYNAIADYVKGMLDNKEGTWDGVRESLVLAQGVRRLRGTLLPHLETPQNVRASVEKVVRRRFDTEEKQAVPTPLAMWPLPERPVAPAMRTAATAEWRRTGMRRALQSLAATAGAGFSYIYYRYGVVQQRLFEQRCTDAHIALCDAASVTAQLNELNSELAGSVAQREALQAIFDQTARAQTFLQWWQAAPRTPEAIEVVINRIISALPTDSERQQFVTTIQQLDNDRLGTLLTPCGQELLDLVKVGASPEAVHDAAVHATGNPIFANVTAAGVPFHLTVLQSAQYGFNANLANVASTQARIARLQNVENTPSAGMAYFNAWITSSAAFVRDNVPWMRPAGVAAGSIGYDAICQNVLEDAGREPLRQVLSKFPWIINRGVRAGAHVFGGGHTRAALLIALTLKAADCLLGDDLLPQYLEHLQASPEGAVIVTEITARFADVVTHYLNPATRHTEFTGGDVVRRWSQSASAWGSLAYALHQAKYGALAVQNYAYMTPLDADPTMCGTLVGAQAPVVTALIAAVGTAALSGLVAELQRRRRTFTWLAPWTRPDVQYYAIGFVTAFAYVAPPSVSLPVVTLVTVLSATPLVQGTDVQRAIFSLGPAAVAASREAGFRIPYTYFGASAFGVSDGRDDGTDVTNAFLGDYFVRQLDHFIETLAPALYGPAAAAVREENVTDWEGAEARWRALVPPRTLLSYREFLRMVHAVTSV